MHLLHVPIFEILSISRVTFLIQWDFSSLSGLVFLFNTEDNYNAT